MFEEFREAFLEIGRDEGRAEEKRRMIHGMFEHDITVDQIVAITGMSRMEVEAVLRAPID